MSVSSIMYDDGSVDFETYLRYESANLEAKVRISSCTGKQKTEESKLVTNRIE